MVWPAGSFINHHGMACWQFHKLSRTEFVTIVPIFIITMIYVSVCVFVVLGLCVWGWHVSECMCHNFEPAVESSSAL